jgi:hypothetical protein
MRSTLFGAGQQTGSKRRVPLGSAIAEPAHNTKEAHEESDSVRFVVHLATLELACHAGGRGFDSRRSRSLKSPANESFRRLDRRQ